MKKFLPILTWLPEYKMSYLKGDLFAGFTTGVLMVPQGMAYALLAGMPPVYGLYAGLVPQIVYVLFGTSRKLSMGPVAMDSMLVATGVGAVAAATGGNYIVLAIFLGLMVGIVQIMMGVLRMGFLVDFLSKPIVSGFTSAAAILIAFSQVPGLLGISIDGKQHFFLRVGDMFSALPETETYTLILGGACVAFMVALRFIWKSFPSALVMVVAATVLSYFMDWGALGIDAIGAVPAGLPDFGLEMIPIESIRKLIPIAFTICMLSYMESVAVAKAMMKERDSLYNGDQELIALGMSNSLGSFFGSFPGAGGFSRSAVIDKSGGKTPMTSVFGFIIVLCALLFMTPAFAYMPKAALSAIIIVAVLGLVDFKFPYYLWRVHKQDFIKLAITFVATLAIGIKEGVAVGVIISIVQLLFRTSRPQLNVLGKLPNSAEYRSIARFEEVEVRPDVLVIRYEAQLYFANAIHFSDGVRRLVAEKGPDLRLVVINSEPISFMDITALEELRQLLAELSKKGIIIKFSGVVGNVRDFFASTGFFDEAGKHCFFLHTQDAIDYFDRDPNEHQEFHFDHAVQSSMLLRVEM